MKLNISKLIKLLEAHKQLHGDAEVVFDIPDLMESNASLNIWGDRNNGAMSEKIHIEVFKNKKTKDYNGNTLYGPKSQTKWTKTAIDITDLEEWWYLVGSGLKPTKEDDYESHAKKVCESFLKWIIWKQSPLFAESEGEYMIRRNPPTQG